MKTLILLLITITSYGQFFAPSLTTIYQDNDLYPGARYGIDMKYYVINHDKEYFFDYKYLHGGNNHSDSGVGYAGIGCKTGYRLKYGAMMSVVGYHIEDYKSESEESKYTGAVAFSPLISYDLNKYFYIESGMSLTAFQVGDFKVANSYFLSFGMRWH